MLRNLSLLKIIKDNFLTLILIFNILVQDSQIRNSMKAMKKFSVVLLVLVVVAIAFSSCSKKTCPAYSQVVVNTTEAKA